ncbi:MAG: lipoate--protein ligase family protein [Chloroflexota bacterium]
MVQNPLRDGERDLAISFGGGHGGAGRSLEIVISPSASVVENLAIDEAMTRSAAADQRLVLRLWWGGSPTIVLGSSEKPEVVADLDACRRLGVEVVRRSTGGGTVLQTPDVLNYSLTAPSPGLPNTRAVFAVGARLLIYALGRLGIGAEAKGISDVAVEGRKISGNALAKRWGGLLLHGTLLLDLDLDLVDACLRHPPREPDYRGRRSHREFLTTLRTLGVVAVPAELEVALVSAARQLAAEGVFDRFPNILDSVRG